MHPALASSALLISVPPRQIVPLTDIDTAWSKELGLTADLSGLGIGLGQRTTRYALVLDDLKVAYIGVRPMSS